MPWQDELKRLRASTKYTYDLRMAKVAVRRSLLEKFAVELSVDSLLTQMNDVLLDGGARLVVNRSWQYEYDNDDGFDDEDDELSDEIVYVLYWHDGSPVEIEVRVGIDNDDGGYVLVEDEEVADSAAAIQSALVEAFREIVDLPG
jgi:hypothetical protein